MRIIGAENPVAEVLHGSGVALEGDDFWVCCTSLRWQVLRQVGAASGARAKRQEHAVLTEGDVHRCRKAKDGGDGLALVCRQEKSVEDVTGHVAHLQKIRDGFAPSHEHSVNHAVDRA